MAHTYTLTIVTEGEIGEAVLVGLCDIVADVINGEGIEVGSVLVSPTKRTPSVPAEMLTDQPPVSRNWWPA